MKNLLLFAAVLGTISVYGRVQPSFEVNVWRGETVWGVAPDWAKSELRREAPPKGVRLMTYSAEKVDYAPAPESRLRASAYDHIRLNTMDAVGPACYRLDISSDMKPGEYRFGPFKLVVADRTLPPPSEWKCFLDLWQHPWAVARYFDVKPFSKEHYRKLAPVYRTLAAAGAKTLTTTIYDLPWGHQCHDAYMSMVKREKQADGSVKFDFSTFDEFVEFGRKCGIGPIISCYTMCPWQGTLKPGSKEFKAEWGPFLEAFGAHLKAKGWLEDTYISMDEREPEDVKATADFVRAKAPGLKIQMAGNRNPADFKGITIDLYSQLLGLDDEAFLAELKARKARGEKTTYYVCCIPEHPNTLITSPDGEQFWLGAWQALGDYDGFLRWAANSWPKDPYADSSYGTWGAGDTYLIYPDGTPSLRFIELRRGIVAAEKLRILTAAGDEKAIAAKKALAAKYDSKSAVDAKTDFRKFREEFEAAVR